MKFVESSRGSRNYGKLLQIRTKGNKAAPLARRLFELTLHGSVNTGTGEKVSESREANDGTRHLSKADDLPKVEGGG